MATDPVMAAPRRQAPIGVFDSGVGGLTVVAALEHALPDERFVYLGDTARVPYGTKSADTVIRYSRQVARFLLGRDVKAIVVACNTASAHAVEALQRELAVPVIGVIEPGARSAAEHTRVGAVGVIATIGTISSQAYRRALHTLRPDLAVFSQACPLFVPLAEEGWGEHPVASQVAQHYLARLHAQAGELDTLVLGCTHYPLLGATIGAVAREIFQCDIRLIDSATAVAKAVAEDLAARDLAVDEAPSSDVEPTRFFVTDESRFAEMAERFLGRAVACDHVALSPA